MWIDTDPALGMLFRDADDGLALLQALHSPELEIAGISVGKGNSDVPDGTRIARRLVANCAHAHSGALPRVYAGRTSAARSSADDALHAALSRRLTYVALGPLTNLAAFLRENPSRAANIRRVIFLGGELPNSSLRAGGWNRYRFTDANFFKDPAAAETVLRAGIPITLVPIDISRGISLSAADMRQLRRASSCSRYVAEKAGGWFLGWRVFFGVREAPVFDALVLLAVTHPQWVRTRFMSYEVQKKGKTPRLLLLPKVEEETRDSVTVITGFDPRAREEVIQRLATPDLQ
ncbi:MAG TPA: nucleoside hydrolase [Chthoniobacteraceae bacterium]